MAIREPIALGHESSGKVEAIGSAVTNVKVGNAVAIEPGSFCRRCGPCRHGRQNLCENMVYIGVPPYNGSLSDHVIVKSQQCVPLSDRISWQEAACLQPLAVAIHNARLAKLRGHQKVLILGSGNIGLLLGAIARS